VHHVAVEALKLVLDRIGLITADQSTGIDQRD
jgi:hypothetical protein